VTVSALLTQAAAVAAAVGLAPLLAGWVNQCRAWLQNRSAPPLLLPYRMLRKLLHKDAVLAEAASPLFRAVPYVVFGCMVVAAGIIPSLGTDLPAGRAADAIALVGLFATARMFIALGAMDVGTAFGTLGARREMLIGFLAEPALLMVLFNLALIGGSTAIPVIADRLLTQGIAVNPSLAFAALAFVMVLLAENARLPIDNPATHLELTMIHEAMVLEYSARHLALIEWASALKLFNYACLGFAFFVPAGLSGQDAGLTDLLLAAGWLVAKLLLAGAALALFESLSAKLRVFRAPEFLAMAFMLAVLGLLTQLLFSGGVA
jgi:formate hydrogenlyase subunit 4